MILTILLCSTLLIVGLFTLMAVVTTQEATYSPSTVNPFGPNLNSDPSSDTIDHMASIPTLTHGWQMNEVKTLREVEEILDWLENHNVRHTELTTMNGKFQVRWQ